jgi:hypothetical protein
MVDGPKGWELQLNPVRAVPESSSIFELARSGELRSVELRIVKSLVSVLDTSRRAGLHYTYDSSKPVNHSKR